MEADDLQKPPFCVLTYRSGQEVISETVETEIAARTRFASAVDLCRDRDDGHDHRVELLFEDEVIDAWPIENQAP